MPLIRFGDLRYAIRFLRNNPSFAAITIGTIALAIGANTAIFSFVHGILLRPLPYPEADRIVRVLERRPDGGRNGISTLNYLDWAAQNTVFESIAAEAGSRATLTSGTEPIAIQTALVSARYFDIFATRLTFGRTFRPDEDQIGKDRVALLSHQLWETHFGADPAVVGRDILLDGSPYTVIGIFEKDGAFDRTPAKVWVPLNLQSSNRTRDFRWLGASAKLKPGVSLAQAQAEMDVIARRLADTHPQTNAGWGVAVDRLADVVAGPQLRTAVKVLFAATAAVLLIGCANLANLALARGISRQNEMAVRAALGASRWQVLRPLLIEHAVMSACGGVVGAGLGYVALRWIHSLIPPYSLAPALDVRMDATVLLFSLTVATLTGLLFGWAPAARSSTPHLVSALKGSRHGTAAGGARRGARGALVVGEIALAFVLLVASGLLVRSFVKLLDVDPGFDATDVLTAGLPIAQTQHPDPVELNGYLRSITAAVQALPGVRATALTSVLPLQGWGFGAGYALADDRAVDATLRRRAFFKIVSPGYFDALRIQLLRGRVLSDRDTAGASPAAVINETLARREFGGRDPIGSHILVREVIAGKGQLGREISWQIVGVVAGERTSGLGDETSAGIYVSNEQSPSYGMHLIVRASVPPESLHRALRSAIARVDSRQALSDVRTLQQIVDQSMLGNRVVSTILTAFAAIALALAGLGTYGVISYTAAQRRHELGIRAALGASEGVLRKLVILRGMKLTVLGLLAGGVLMVDATRTLSSMLYGVGPHDPVTIAVVTILLIGVGAVASCVPAWRIIKADPMDALRSL